MNTRSPLSATLKRGGGYTLVEMLFAMGITSIMFFAGMSAITFSKIQLTKDRERAIISDFAVHYLETVRGLTFNNVVGGFPINPIYDGVSTTESGKQFAVRIPADFSWQNLNTAAYQTFCPDLQRIQGRNPAMRMSVDTLNASGVPRVKSVRMEIRWDSPLGYGRQNNIRLDMVRVKDIEKE